MAARVQLRHPPSAALTISGMRVWKRTFSASEVAGSIATGQVTSDSLR